MMKVIKRDGRLQELDLEKIIKIAVVKGMDNDTLRTLNIDCANKYGNAYKKVQSMAK